MVITILSKLHFLHKISLKFTLRSFARRFVTNFRPPKLLEAFTKAILTMNNEIIPFVHHIFLLVAGNSEIPGFWGWPWHFARFEFTVKHETI